MYLLTLYLNVNIQLMKHQLGPNAKKKYMDAEKVPFQLKRYISRSILSYIIRPQDLGDNVNILKL
jgi:hypothetical protein